jgi:hypothetical protein
MGNVWFWRLGPVVLTAVMGNVWFWRLGAGRFDRCDGKRLVLEAGSGSF